jgi:hypothetical protein
MEPEGSLPRNDNTIKYLIQYGWYSGHGFLQGSQDSDLPLNDQFSTFFLSQQNIEREKNKHNNWKFCMKVNNICRDGKH